MIKLKGEKLILKHDRMRMQEMKEKDEAARLKK